MISSALMISVKSKSLSIVSIKNKGVRPLLELLELARELVEEEHQAIRRAASLGNLLKDVKYDLPYLRFFCNSHGL